MTKKAFTWKWSSPLVDTIFILSITRKASWFDWCSKNVANQGNGLAFCFWNDLSTNDWGSFCLHCKFKKQAPLLNALKMLPRSKWVSFFGRIIVDQQMCETIDRFDSRCQKQFVFISVFFFFFIIIQKSQYRFFYLFFNRGNEIK